MKKRMLSMALSLALLLGAVGPAIAVESPSIYVDGQPVVMMVNPLVVNRTTYVPYLAVVQAMYPDATAAWENDRAVLRASGLTIEIGIGNCYLVANGRYLYFPGGVIVQNGDIFVPVRTLAQAMGAVVTWDSGTVYLQSSTGAIADAGQFYDSNDVYWLSHIIYAESGNQPLAGKIAVGNVVLNRMANPAFPNTVYDTVFQRGQFTPVQNGSIYLTPSTESIVAAKLCLDGANTAGNSLYFVNYHYSSWATRNRPYVATIGAHAFYA
ncbi:MAG TPA: cell wall hydrolase [Pseudoflavonifractor sp.]|nr:cell wall hydrolase [Pseudoflavonifractor sp.]